MSVLADVLKRIQVTDGDLRVIGDGTATFNTSNYFHCEGLLVKFVVPAKLIQRLVIDSTLNYCDPAASDAGAKHLQELQRQIHVKATAGTPFYRLGVITSVRLSDTAAAIFSLDLGDTRVEVQQKQLFDIISNEPVTDEDLRVFLLRCAAYGSPAAGTVERAVMMEARLAFIRGQLSLAESHESHHRSLLPGNFRGNALASASSELDEERGDPAGREGAVSIAHFVPRAQYKDLEARVHKERETKNALQELLRSKDLEIRALVQELQVRKDEVMKEVTARESAVQELTRALQTLTEEKSKVEALVEKRLQALKELVGFSKDVRALLGLSGGDLDAIREALRMRLARSE